VDNTNDHPSASAALQWDDLRLFLAVADLGGMRSAAKELRLSLPSLTRRMRQLEKETGTILFARSYRGSPLTQAGQEMRKEAEEILRRVQSIIRKGQSRASGVRATVKVGVTEGIGAFWLVPRLEVLRKRHPDVSVDLICQMQPLDVRALDADISLQFEKPEDPDLKIVRIACIHIVMFASAGYIAERGMIESKAEIPLHEYIEIVGPQMDNKALSRQVDTGDERKFVNLRVNTPAAQFMAATFNCGVTALPVYARAISSQLMHVAKDFSLSRDLWLVYNPWAAELGHVRAVIDWLRDSFNSAQFPWFGADLMTPDEIDAYLAGLHEPALFSRFC